MRDEYDERRTDLDNIARGLFAIANAITEHGYSVGIGRTHDPSGNIGSLVPGALEFIGIQLRDLVSASTKRDEE